MSNISRLKSRDPAERKAAIRAVARAKDRNALKQLARMASDDHDKEIQKLAAQAVTYIRRQLGEIPAEGGKDSKQAGKEAAKVGVSEQDEAKARRAVGNAQTFLMQNDKSKAASLLRKALQLNPNLRSDSYLLSLAEEITGAEGPEAIASLADRAKFKAMAEQEAAETRGKAAMAHEKEIGSTGWGDVLFDMGLYTVIALVGAVIAFFLLTQSAQGFQDRYDQNIEDVRAAWNEPGRPRIDWKDGSSESRIADIDKIRRADNPEATFTVMDPEEQFLATVEDWRESEPKDFLPPALAIGAGSAVAVLISAFLIHFFAQVIFRGHGRLPHTIHSVAMVFVSRLILFLVILYAGTVLIFYLGGGMTVTGLLVAEAGVGLIVILSCARAVAKACDQGFGTGFIATVIGLAPAVAAGVFVAMEVGVLTLSSS